MAGALVSAGFIAGVLVHRMLGPIVSKILRQRRRRRQPTRVRTLDVRDVEMTSIVQKLRR